MGMFDFLADRGGYTYEDVQRRRALVDALAQTGSPRTFGEGLSSVGGAIGAILGGRRADAAEEKRAAMADGVFEAALGSVPQDNSALASALAPQTASFQPTGNALRDGILETAQAIGADPLDLATAVSYETAGTFDPMKAGPTTQWGQHRGLIQFGEPQAQQYGADFSSPDAALSSQLGADGAIANYFRSSGFKPGMGGLDLYSTINAGAPGRYSASDANNGGAPGSVADKWNNQMGDHRAKAAALLGGDYQPSPQMAFSPQPQGVNVALIRAMNNPYLSPEQKQILAGVMAQQQAQQITPYQQAQLQMEQERHALDMAQANQPAPVEGVNVGGALVNPITGEVMYQEQTEAGFRQATPDEAAAYGATGGQFGPDGRFYPINPPSGMSIETGPDGQVRVVQGAGASGAAGKPFTEGQSKDNVFATRAEGALAAFEPVADKLTSRVDRLAEYGPMGVTRGLQDPDFQLAKQAGDEFMQAILRKDTGAAITPQEQELYGKTYLPQPGDGPEVLEARKQARRRALEAIKAGMSPAQIIAQEIALQQSGSQQVPPPDTPVDTPSDDDLINLYGG